MIFLPRQARDKHRETSKPPDRFLAEFLYEMGSLQVRFEQLDALCFLAPFSSIWKTIILDLPRQARDKRRDCEETGLILC
eukprot:COSAG06_NODE_794_length_12246_cov_7.203836_2_plen_80_part_00